MSSTYIDLVKQFVLDVGIEGSVQSDIGKLVGMHEKVAYWIAEADIELQRRYIDWGFLYKTFKIKTIANINRYQTPEVARGLVSSKLFTLTLPDQTVVWLPETAFSLIDELPPGIDIPHSYAIGPDKALYLYPTPDKPEYLFEGAYYLAPKRLRASGDRSPIPEHFDRLILTQAKLMWAEHEEAVVPLNKSSHDLAGMLAQLEAEFLPGNSARSFGHAARQEAVVLVE